MFQISRRDLVLGAAGAYAAFGLSKPIAFIGAAEAQQTPAGPSFRKYNVGDIEVISLYDGVWEKPHDENFIKGTNVEQTKAELKAGGLTDAHVPVPFTVLAVKTGGRLVLIDFRHRKRTDRRPQGWHPGTEHGRSRSRPEGRQDHHHLAFPR